MMKKSLAMVSAIALLAVTFLTGCSMIETVEVSQRAFIEVMGIDVGSDRMVNITMQVIQAKQNGSEATADLTIVSGQGRTVSEATQNAELTLSRRLFSGHCKAIIVGDGFFSDRFNSIDSLLRDDINSYLELFMDSNKLSPATNIVFMPNGGRASDGVKALAQMEDGDITKLLNTAHNNTKTENATIMSFFGEQNSIGNVTLLPNLWVGDEYDMELNGVTVIKYGGAIGQLNQTETKGIRIMKNSVDKLTLPFAIDKINGNILLYGMSTCLTPRLENGTVIMDVKLSAKGRLLEPSTLSLQNSNSEITSAQIEETAQLQLISYCQSAVAQSKGLGADTLFVNKILKKFLPNYFAENKDDFDSIILEIEYAYDFNVALDERT